MSVPNLLKTVTVTHPETGVGLSFQVNAALDFKELTDDLSRSFEFPGGDVITVDKPALMAGKPNIYGIPGGGSMRIIDLGGAVHSIPYGWLRLKWSPRPGFPTVAF